MLRNKGYSFQHNPKGKVTSILTPSFSNSLNEPSLYLYSYYLNGYESLTPDLMFHVVGMRKREEIVRGCKFPKE